MVAKFCNKIGLFKYYTTLASIRTGYMKSGPKPLPPYLLAYILAATKTNSFVFSTTKGSTPARPLSVMILRLGDYRRTLGSKYV